MSRHSRPVVMINLVNLVLAAAALVPGAAAAAGASQPAPWEGPKSSLTTASTSHVRLLWTPVP